MKQLITIAIAFAMVACETPPTRREILLSESPEWDPKIVKIIQAGMITKGMTKEQVRTAWGHPCYPCTGTVEGDWGAAWEYRTQVVFFDKQGFVSRWTHK